MRIGKFAASFEVGGVLAGSSTRGEVCDGALASLAVRWGESGAMGVYISAGGVWGLGGRECIPSLS